MPDLEDIEEKYEYYNKMANIFIILWSIFIGVTYLSIVFAGLIESIISITLALFFLSVCLYFSDKAISEHQKKIERIEKEIEKADEVLDDIVEAEE